MNLPPSLNSEGEATWSRFQRALSWREGFAIVFLFTDFPTVADIFRQRLADIYRARVRGLRLLQETPATPDELLNTLLTSLFQADNVRQALAAPVWIDLQHKPDDPEWNNARRNLLARLNERRAAVIQQHHWPLLLVLPAHMASEIASYAPDLWAIRHLGLRLDNWLTPTTRKPHTSTTEQPLSPESQYSTQYPTQPNPPVISKTEQSLLNEWDRVQDLNQADPGILRIGWAASEVYERHGLWHEKYRIDQANLALARPPTPTKSDQIESTEDQRNLSISLDNVGNTHKALDQWEKARIAFDESLEISRKLLSSVGETPQALRDISVSLDNVGNTHQALDQWEKARIAYQQGYELAKQLREALPEISQFSKLPKHFTKRLKALEEKRKLTTKAP